MPRAAKKDIRVTALAREQGWIHHPKSFISLDGHLFLHRSEKAAQRVLIFRKHKRCAVCQAQAIEFGEPGFASEWHHIRNCDCVGCAEVRCGQILRDCHRHRTTGFKREIRFRVAAKQKAAREFTQLYPEDNNVSNKHGDHQGT